MTKVIIDFGKGVHWMHFVCKKWKTIHSLFRLDFCFAECVKSFENVASVLTYAC